MMDITPAYQVQTEMQGPDPAAAIAWGGFQCRGRGQGGMGLGGGRR